MSFTVTKNNTISFNRISSANILDYKIYANEFFSDHETKTLIETVLNVRETADNVDDKIIRTYTATNKTEYSIIPTIINSSAIGDHNIVM